RFTHCILQLAQMSWSSRSAFSVLLTLIGLHCFTVLGGSTQQIVDDHNNAADLVLSLGVHHVGIASSAQQRNNDAPTTLAAEDHFFVYSAHAIECSNDSDDDIETSTFTT
ncbi:membrane-associated protein, putative, partial [Bodo saltans]